MDAKTKRDLIWEQKKRQREERLARGGDTDQPQQMNIYPNERNMEQQPFTREKREDLFVPTNQAQMGYEPQQSIPYQPATRQAQQPVSFPTVDPMQFNQPMQESVPQQQNIQEPYKAIPRNNAISQHVPQAVEQEKFQQKQIKQDYADQLRQQMQEKEAKKLMERARVSQSVDKQIDQPDLRQKQNKNDYAEFLRRQMQEKEEQKQRGRQNQPPPPQQPPQQQYYDYGQPQQAVPNGRQQMNNQTNPMEQQKKQEYAEYLRRQMKEKEDNKSRQRQISQQPQQNPPQYQQPYQQPPYQQQQHNDYQDFRQPPHQSQPQQMYHPPPPQQQPPQQQYQPNSYQQQNYEPQPPMQQFNQYLDYQRPSDYQNEFDRQQDTYQPPPQQNIQLPNQQPPLTNHNRRSNHEPTSLLPNENPQKEVKKQQKQEYAEYLKQQMQMKEEQKKKEKMQKKLEDQLEEQRIAEQIRQENEEIEKNKQKNNKQVQQVLDFNHQNVVNLDPQETDNPKGRAARLRRREQQLVEQEPQNNQQMQQQDYQNQYQQQGFGQQASNPLFPDQQMMNPQIGAMNHQLNQQMGLLNQPLMNPQMAGMNPPLAGMNSLASLNPAIGFNSLLGAPMMQPPLVQNPMLQAQQQYLSEVEMMKRQMQEQQQELQRQIQQVMSKAHEAIDDRNKAEQQLNQLKQQVMGKYAQEEQNYKDLMVALVKNDPKWEKQVFPPHLLAQMQINEERDLGMPSIADDKISYDKILPDRKIDRQQFIPVMEGKPVAFKQESAQEKKKFNQEFGLQSLVSDSNFVPIEGSHETDMDLGAYSNPNKNNGINYQNYKQNEIFTNNKLPQIDELNKQYEDSIYAGDTYNLERFEFLRPHSQQKENQWNVPSINSDISKEIDQLLNYKAPLLTLNDTTKQQQSIPSRQNKRLPSAKMRPPSNQQGRPDSSTFNRAAQQILGDRSIGMSDYNVHGLTLDSDFPDLTMNYNNQPRASSRNQRSNNATHDKKQPFMDTYNTNTFDIAVINKRTDERLMKLNDMGQQSQYNEGQRKSTLQADEDLDKLEYLLQHYNDK